MKNDENSNSMLVELLRPLVQEAVTEAIFELATQVKPRTPPPFSADEAAEFLHMPKSSLYQLTSKGKIPFHKRSKRLYFYQDELDKWFKSEG